LTQNVTGGSGGGTDTGAAGAGGSATSTLGTSTKAYANTSASSFTATLNATGGAGGFASSGSAGAGGIGTASLYLVSSATDAPHATGSSNARGGAVTSGVGGAASAEASVTSPNSANATAAATGGAGPTPGTATATATATGSVSGNVLVNAVARANSFSSSTNLGNTANATADTTSIGSITGVANANSAGSAGTALAQSAALDPAVTGQKVVAIASAPSNVGTVSTQTMATIAGSWFGSPTSSSNGETSYAQAMGSPTPAVQAAIVNSSTPNTQAALAGSSIFGAGVLGTNYTASSGSVQYTASTEHVFNLSGSNTITLGLLNFGGNSTLALSSLSFTVKEGSTSLLSNSFSTLAAAETFFKDDPLSLGKLTGPVDLTLSYHLTENQPGGFGISYVLADAPAGGAVEPRAQVLMRHAHDPDVCGTPLGAMDRFSLVKRGGTLTGPLLNTRLVSLTTARH
jgi:hypothetical protein